MRLKSDFFKPISNCLWVGSPGRDGEFGSAFGN